MEVESWQTEYMTSSSLSAGSASICFSLRKELTKGSRWFQIHAVSPHDPNQFCIHQRLKRVIRLIDKVEVHVPVGTHRHACGSWTSFDIFHNCFSYRLCSESSCLRDGRRVTRWEQCNSFSLFFFPIDFRSPRSSSVAVRCRSRRHWTVMNKTGKYLFFLLFDQLLTSISNETEKNGKTAMSSVDRFPRNGRKRTDFRCTHTYTHV